MQILTMKKIVLINYFLFLWILFIANINGGTFSTVNSSLYIPI